MRHEEFISFLHETGHGSSFRETKQAEIKIDKHSLVIYLVENADYLTFRIRARGIDDYHLHQVGQKIVLAPDLPESTWAKLTPLLATFEETASS